jgi:hypothetical protein
LGKPEGKGSTVKKVDVTKRILLSWIFERYRLA